MTHTIRTTDRAGVLRILFALMFAASLMLGARPAGAITQVGAFTVNRLLDRADAVPGDGFCDYNPAADGDQCSLRAAIMEGNAVHGMAVITLPAGAYTFTRAGRGEDGASTGDLDITDATEIKGEGAGKTIVDAAQLDRVFHIIAPSVGVKLSGITIQNGSGLTDPGGGIMNAGSDLVVDNSVIANNKNTAGAGGIYQPDGKLTLQSSTVRDNTVMGSGGGLYVSAHTRIFNSTISGNTATDGGGIMHGGDVLVVMNSTVASNRAKISAGGIASYSSAGAPQLLSVTIAGNIADDDDDGLGDGGGIAIANGSEPSIRNSIIALNVDRGNQKPDCSGQLSSDGYNLIQNASGCILSGYVELVQIGVNPRLSVLKNNGGPTFTRAPLAGSPVVDAGDPSGCTDYVGEKLYQDQRENTRYVDGNADGTLTCDLGAHEFAGPIVTAISPKSRTAGLGSFTLTITGVRFTSSSVVRWNGANRSTKFVDEHTLKATILAGDVQTPATNKVTVFTPEPGGGHSNPRIFTVKP